MPDFRKATNPNHITLGFPQTCQDLPQHGRMAAREFQSRPLWVPHHGRAHAKLQCGDCHIQRQLQPDQHYVRELSPQGLPAIFSF